MSVHELTAGTFRELAHRSRDGVEVALFWCEGTADLTVCVSDERAGAQFEIAVDAEHALDAFDHPYAYAAFQGIPYEDVLVTAWAQTEGDPVHSVHPRAA